MNNPFNWREYVQPFVAVPVVTDSGHVHQEKYEMVPSESITMSLEEKRKERQKLKSKADWQLAKAKKEALRVNPYSDVGRSTGLTNSEKAAR